MKCLYKCDGTEGARCQPPTTPLTICDLQLSLGEDAACNGQSLADIVTGISPLHGRNGEVAAGRHREATAGLLRLVGKEQILWKEEQTFQLGEKTEASSTWKPDKTQRCRKNPRTQLRNRQ